MKRWLTFMLVMGLLAVSGGLADVSAQVDSGPTWGGRIAYFNTTTEGAPLNVVYYDADGNPYAQDGDSLPLVPPYGSGTFLVNSTLPESGGAAVLEAPLGVLAVYEQVATGADVKYGQPMYSGMEAQEAGGLLFVPYFVYQYSELYYKTPITLSATLGVQNVTDAPVDVRVLENGVELAAATIPPQSGRHFDGEDLGLAAGTRTALVVEGPDSSILGAVVVEQESDGRRAFAYEAQGPARASQSLTMSRLTCSTLTRRLRSRYYVQASEDTTVDVLFYTNGGSKINPSKPLNFTGLAVGAGQSLEIDPCLDSRLAGKTGSVVVTSSGAALTGVGMVRDRYGVGTTFAAQVTPAPAPSYRYALPYVVWGKTSTLPRTYISMLNLGAAKANIEVRYYRSDGSLGNKKNPTLRYKGVPLHAVRSTTPYSAYVLRSGAFAGAVELISDQPLLVTARVQRAVTKVPGTTRVAEDYDAFYLP